MCSDLFELEYDDGVRNWGAYLKPASQRIGIAAANGWLHDPIPVNVPRQNNTADGASAARNTTNVGTKTVPNFNDRRLAI